MNREQIAARLVLADHRYQCPLKEIVAIVETIVREAETAERHRIYAALEADPGALWRDQGFQEWRKNRQDSDRR